MPRCHYQIQATKPPNRTITPRPYPQSPITLGDHLRKKRLDLGLMQKQVAESLKTSVDNIRNWEANRRKVSLQFLPKVYDFVGFCPCDVKLPLGLKLKERREYFGLTIKKLSEILKVDSCTIAYWERGEHLPSQLSTKMIEGFLTSFLPDKENMQEFESFIRNNSFSELNLPNFIAYESRWSVEQKMTAWRIGTELSQRQLANLSEICFQSICRWENGQRIPSNNYKNWMLHTIVVYLDTLLKIK